MQTLCLFALHPTGFRHRDARAHVALLLGRDPCMKSEFITGVSRG
jgi:hypothetical protein